jgi:hypothetical protein
VKKQKVGMHAENDHGYAVSGLHIENNTLENFGNSVTSLQKSHKLAIGINYLQKARQINQGSPPVSKSANQHFHFAL